jgi:hypothetical protein
MIKICDGAVKPSLSIVRGFQSSRSWAREMSAALARIRPPAGAGDDARVGAGHIDHHCGQFHYREFLGIADIHWTGHLRSRRHQSEACPVVSGSDFSMARSTNVSISSKISATDAHHDTITQFGFWDKTSDLVSAHPSGLLPGKRNATGKQRFCGASRKRNLLGTGFKRLALRFKEAISSWLDRRSPAF